LAEEDDKDINTLLFHVLLLIFLFYFLFVTNIKYNNDNEVFTANFIKNG